ncbi:MAG TPA: type VI secretion system tip protein TssI/VgrG [Fibrobacteria bacterium]|nr:type VI secretion system tip protein TssI/VgrG [Fibrobacteria bacterium]
MPSSTSLKFSLKIGALGPDKFRVLEFTMSEAVSECYHLHVQASSEDGNVAYADMIGMDATLTVEGKDFSVNHDGVVTEFNQYPDGSGNFGRESYVYDIVVEPRFKLLSFNTQNRVFLKKKLKAIVEEVLKANSLTAADYEYNVKGTPREREYTVQYNETDLDFLSRLLEDEGIYYYFDHTGEKEKLILADSVDGVKPIPHTQAVDLLDEAGLSHLAKEGESPDHISRMRRTQRMVTGKVTIKDYNDRTPGVNVIGKASKPGQGESYHYGPQALNTTEAERVANLRADMHAAGKVQLEGEGICRAFRTGMRFELKDPHGQSHFEGKYTLLRVVHHGDQREGFEGNQEKLIYSNTFQCLPADVVYRPALRTPKPRIHGILSAKVDGVDGRYAYLDDDGRYHAKLPFDLTDRKDGQASLPIRMNQPYGGPDYGMHFPVHNGNEMVLGFEDGDPDRPIMLGTVPNPGNGSPVNKRNPSESIIRTASGHVIRLDDKDGKTVIEITTKGRHVITLDDDPDRQGVRIKTTDRNELVFHDKQKHVTLSTPEGAHTLKMDYDKKVFSVETKYGHKLTMDDEAKVIAMQTKEGHILQLNDDKQLLSLQDGKGKHVFQIDAGGGKVSITTEGDMEFAAKGSLNIEAKEITMEAKQGAMNLKSKQDMALDGMNVNVAAKQKMALEAKMDASIKGLNVKTEGKVNVESKAGVQNKMTGVMTNVESSAINTVKGAMVMIN